MTNQECIMKVLEKYGSCNSNSISVIARRDFGMEISPASAGRTMGAMYKKGMVGKSNCGAGRTYYWANT